MVFCWGAITEGYHHLAMSESFLRHASLSRLRFRHLELARTLAHTGSLHKTARRLGLSQPAVSKAIREIEGITGVELFARGPRGTELTRAGSVLVRGAEMLLRELDYLGSELPEANSDRGTLRIGAPPVLVTWMVPHALAAVRAADPKLRLQVFEGALPQLIKQLEQGVLHCVMGLLTPEMLEAGRASNLSCERLYDERLEVIAPRAHPMARRQRIGWAEIARSDWILPPERTLVHQALARAFAEAGLLLPLPVVESAQLATNIELVAAGVGIGLAPHIAARVAEARKIVRLLAVESRVSVPPVAVLVRVSREDTAIVETLIDAARSLGAA
jgi:LysR family transcriptional regulator, regulator of abg operon